MGTLDTGYYGIFTPPLPTGWRAHADKLSAGLGRMANVIPHL